MAPVKKQRNQNGYGEKVQVKIITVDKERRRVECAMRDGAMVWAAVWETGTVFRWPEVGETWTIRKDTGVWRLDQIVQTELNEAESEATPKTLEELGEGDTRIMGETVHVNTLNVSKLEGIQEFVPSARVYASSVQTIPNVTLTAAIFEGVRHDNAEMHKSATPTRLYAPIAGVYEIVFNFSWFYAANGERFADIIVNATTQIASQRFNPNAGGAAEMFVATTSFLNAGDYVECRVYQTIGAPLNLWPNNLQSPAELSMTYLGNNLPKILPRPDTTSPGHDWGQVLTLPKEANYGDYCTFKAGTGIFWRLMYSGEETYPWAKIGGPPLTAQSGFVVQTESEVPQTAGAPTIVMPALTCITSATYGSTRAICGTGSFTQIGIYNNGVLQTEPSYAGTSIQTNPSSLLTNLPFAPGATAQVRYCRLGGSGLAQYIGLFLSIDPVRVG